MLIDETGIAYNVEDDILNLPNTGGPTKRLYDQATGQVFDLPADLFAETPANGSGPDPLPKRTLGYQEKLIEVLLERTSMDVPDRKRVELLISPLLAVGKITSKEDYYVALMEIENLIRSLYISNAITEEDSIYLMDQVEFFARWQLRRSCTYDGKPNEREWWTIQSIHQKTEVKGEQPGGGGSFLNSIGRVFGKRRY